MKYFISVILMTALISCGGGDKKDSPDTIEETKEELNTEVQSEETEEVLEETQEENTEEGVPVTTDTPAEETPKKNETDNKVTASKSEWTGFTVNLAAVTKGDTKKLDKNTAMTLFKNNQVLGFMSDGNVYMVYNSSGMYDGKELVRNADSESYTIGGTMKNINGMNVIIAKSYK